VFGLPDAIRAGLFDLDGVLTPTAVVHAAAWKEMFDEYLQGRAARGGEPFRPFDQRADYEEFVDGKPRLDGTRSFLESRGIHLPEGQPDDAPGIETIHGLSNRKNNLVLAKIKAGGVTAYPGSVAYLEALRAGGISRAVVSSSSNCHDILMSARIDGFFDVQVDGVVAERERLAGKPAPDTFLAAARHLGVDPKAAAVFEDALAGVAAGRAGGFGFVVGVDRVGQGPALEAHGADVVVSDLGDLLDHRS
jgi:beta-phosphoglucomutase family hydrolase